MKERFVRWYQDKGDANSTSNLRKHAKRCWGDDVVIAADDVGNADTVWKSALGGKMTAASIHVHLEKPPSQMSQNFVKFGEIFSISCF